MVMNVTEIQCYLLKPELKIFTQTLDRLPLTVKIFDGVNFGIWRNGSRELESATISFARYQTFWDFVLGNFPVITLDSSNTFSIMDQETIGDETYIKIDVKINQNIANKLPGIWYNLYVDNKTGLISKLLCKFDLDGFEGMVRLVEFSDYRVVEGINLPHKLLVYSASRKGIKNSCVLAEITRETITFARSVKDELFNFNSHIFLER